MIYFQDEPVDDKKQAKKERKKKPRGPGLSGSRNEL